MLLQLLLFPLLSLSPLVVVAAAAAPLKRSDPESCGNVRYQDPDGFGTMEQLKDGKCHRIPEFAQYMNSYNVAKDCTCFYFFDPGCISGPGLFVGYGGPSKGSLKKAGYLAVMCRSSSEYERRAELPSLPSEQT